jgi:diaminopimelate decarboxylase
MNPDQAGALAPTAVVALAQQFGTPLYAYDEATIRAKCRAVLAMPNAFGLHAGFAIKANCSRALLQVIASEGMGIDASSLNEARRAIRAGIPAKRIMLTSQDIAFGQDRADLEQLIAEGMTYNVCSLRQLTLVADCARKTGRGLSMRVNPGVGTGETVTRNTGDKYSSFGIHLANLEQVLAYAREHGVVIKQVHTHIGSGGDPEVWRENIDRVLGIAERYFPDATAVNLGGGFKEARMPDETAADIEDLGRSAKARFEALAARTGRRLLMMVEPGTYIMANAGHVVARVIDKKSSGPDGFDFLVLDAGMETCTRPLLYGSRHPFYVVSKTGRLLSSEFSAAVANEEERVIAGRCCESGDCQTLDDHGKIVPRRIANPEADDYVVIGGAGAYCSSMSLVGYNSYCQPAEILVREDGSFLQIRKRQTLDQLTQNELSL